MIKLRDYTPDVYYRESRDFQFIGRLFDLVLNSVKTEADLLYNVPFAANSNDKLLDLLALTLGFKTNHLYTTKQLRAICEMFPQILKNKGSIKAVIMTCNALLQAAGLEQETDYDFVGDDHTEVNIYVPQEFGDIEIINDVLSYVLPAGMSCNIIKELRLKTQAITEIVIVDTPVIYSAGDEAEIMGNKTIQYNNNKLSAIGKYINALTDTELHVGCAKDKSGYIINGAIFKATEKLNVIPDNDENNGD